jgi:enamine deaminase RidA (YjgF/YER057c/UK114 family)
VFANRRIALASAGATFSDVVKMTTYITSVGNVATLREIRGKHLDPARPPANTLVPVATLARPEFLLEIEAVAVLRK